MKERIEEQFNQQTPQETSAAESGKKAIEIADKLLNNITDDYPAFSEEVRRAYGDYFRGEVSKDQLEKNLTLFQAKETNIGKAVDRLQEMDLIVSKDKGGKLIVDLTKIRELSATEAKNRGLFNWAGATDINSTLHRIFKNRQVVSKEDFEKDGEAATPKDLFFSPRTKKEALSVDSLRGDSFYFSFLDFTRHPRLTKSLDSYPSLIDKSLNNLEIGTLLLIYHKAYGNGYRNENGVLMVRGPETKEYKPISTGFFQKHNFGAIQTQGEGEERSKFKTRAIYNTPSSFIKEFLPNVEKDLLSPDDFRMISGFPSVQEQRIKRDIPEATHGETITLNGLTHYLGSSFKGKHIRVYGLTEDLAGITEVGKNKQETLVYIFNIMKPEETEKSNRQGRYVFKDDIGLRKYDKTEFSHKHSYETEEEYHKRIEATDDFVFMIAFSRDLSERASINLMDWTFGEQKIVAGAAKTMKYAENRDKILNFAQKFGADGLKTFLSLEYGEEMGEKILAIGDNLKRENADLIFTKYSEIVGIVNREIVDYIREHFGGTREYDKQMIDRITEKLLLRGKDLLVDFAQEIQDKAPEEVTKMQKGLMGKLSQHEEDIALFCTIFQSLFKNKGEQVDFNEFPGIDFFKRDISELPDETKKEMLEISEANWLSRDGGQEIVREFSQALQKTGGSIYWILKRNDRIIAFIRFDITDKPGHLYAGSFNVDSKYRDSAVGEAVRKQSFAEMGRDHVIEGTADPSDSSNIVSKYIEEDGFIITGLKPFPGEMGYRLKIRRDRGREEEGEYLTKNMDKDFILSRIGQQKKDGKYIIRAYDGKDIKSILADLQELTELGYSGTRYFRDGERKIYVFEKTSERKQKTKSPEKLKTAA